MGNNITSSKKQKYLSFVNKPASEVSKIMQKKHPKYRIMIIIDNGNSLSTNTAELSKRVHIYCDESSQTVTRIIVFK